MADHAHGKLLQVKQPSFVIVKDTTRGVKGKGLPGLARATMYHGDASRANTVTGHYMVSRPTQLQSQWHLTQEGYQMRVSEQSIIDALQRQSKSVLPSLTVSSPDNQLPEAVPRSPTLKIKPEASLLNRTTIIPSVPICSSPKDVTYSHLNEPSNFFQSSVTY